MDFLVVCPALLFIESDELLVFEAMKEWALGKNSVSSLTWIEDRDLCRVTCPFDKIGHVTTEMTRIAFTCFIASVKSIFEAATSSFWVALRSLSK